MKLPNAQLQGAIVTALSGIGYTVTAAPVPDCSYPFVQIGPARPVEDLSGKGQSGAKLEVTITAWDDATVSMLRLYQMLEAVSETIKPDADGSFFAPTMTNHYVAGCRLTPPDIFPDLGNMAMRGELVYEFDVFQK